MITFEYKIFNLSEVTIRNKRKEVGGSLAPVTMLNILNEHGAEGWEICLRLNDNSFLMKKVIDAGVTVSTGK